MNCDVYNTHKNDAVRWGGVWIPANDFCLPETVHHPEIQR